jgi:hypothetical protein
MKTMKMFLFGIVLLACFAVFLPSSVFATITIGTPGFNKDKVYEQEQVVFTVPIVSDNDVTSASVVIKNITLDSTNISSTSNKTYTLTRIGSATNGNWIYFFTLGPGIYQLSKAIATDNTSLIQSRNFEEGITYAFKVLASSTTSTTTTTAATSATTTTTTATSVTTSTTTTSTPSTILEKLFSNPIYIVAISLVIVVPVILMIIILTKKPEVTSVPENAESSGGSGKSDESSESNESSKSQS